MAKKSADAKKGGRTKNGRPKEKEPTYSALDMYIARIGAEQRNFRRYVVREETRELYHRDAAVITIKKDRTITCTDEAYAPTEEEAKAITAELKAREEWPVSQAVRDTHSLRKHIKEKHGRNNPTLFEFPDASGLITFVQERVYDKAGEKADLPWSYWSDGQWHMMEPDGDLPLWGVDRLKNAITVFIHEGAKTAQYLSWLPNDTYEAGKGLTAHPWLAECPWRERFRFAAHIGWPGGAPNPHRVDWSPIQKLSPHVEVILVCDHDPPGENAASYISRTLKRRLSVVRFGAEFPRGFDLSDQFPESLFQERKGQKVYVGPTLDDCMEPATWATAKERLRPEFVEEWLYTIKPPAFINRARLDKRYAPEEFNATIAPYSDTANVANALRKHVSAKAESIIYHPGKKTGRISHDGAQVVNVFQPTTVMPKEGDPREFLDFIDYLVPGPDDQKELLRWIATLVTRPDIRMTYGVLAISTVQGVGKTTLAEKILAPLVGQHNCSFPSANEVVRGENNGWLAYKRLVVIAEIYDGHTAQAYNRMKSAITDENIRVNEKYIPQYDLQNFVHVFASSNSFKALKIDDHDRRWFVPGITEQGRPQEYFKKLRAWLEDDGLGIVMQWARDYLEEHKPVPAGTHAPVSEAKRRSIEEGRSEGERLIAEAADALAEEKAKVVLRLDELRAWLKNSKAALDPRQFGSDGQFKLETSERIASILRARGLRLPGKQFKVGRERFRVVTNFAVADDVTWKELEPYYRKAHDWLPM